MNMHRILAIAPAYRLGITLVFIGVIVALSIAPGIERPGDSMFSWLVVNTDASVQKTLHVAVYATLAVLWMWTLQHVESRTTRIVVTLVAAVGLGAILEWYQTKVTGRYGTVADVLLNAVGAILGLLAALLLL